LPVKMGIKLKDLLIMRQQVTDVSAEKQPTVLYLLQTSS
jgi:hypothetical protein